MKSPALRSLPWRKRGFMMILIMVGFCLGVGVNYYGFLFEKIIIRLSIDTIDNSNSSWYAAQVLERWPFIAKSNNILENVSKGSSFVVPNIVHFIWFAKDDQREMLFLNFISIYSAYKIQKPDVIMFHCNHLPRGLWWNELWKRVPIRLMHRDPPTTIHGQNIIHLYHQGDVSKIDILIEHGGIYLDYDVIVLNTLDPLRKYDTVFGKEKPPKVIAGIILASKNALFLRLLKESYRDNYRPLDWDYNCARVAYQIALKRPDLIYVEPFRLTTPDWGDRNLLWKEVIDWSGLYVIHVMGHFDWNEHSPESIKKQNSTFGQVMRYIYYNSTKLITS